MLQSKLPRDTLKWPVDLPSLVKNLDAKLKSLVEALNRTVKQTGAAVPATIPNETGQFFFDDVNGAAYVSVKTGNVLSWKKITP